MRKFILALLICLICLPAFGKRIYDESKWADDFTKKEKTLIKDIEEKTVRLFAVGEGNLGYCSGTILKNNSDGCSVLTAKHCLGLFKELYVEDKKVDMVITIADEDLALVFSKQIKDKRKAKVSFFKPKVGDMLYFVGYPGEVIRRRRGEVVRYTDDWGWSKVDAIPGCSGGGMFDKEGELVGVLWGGAGDEVSIFEPLLDVRKFLKKAYKINK